MSDITKQFAQLHKTMELHRSLIESPTARILQEMKTITAMQEAHARAIRSIPTVTVDITRAFDIQPRLAAEIAAIEKSLQVNRRLLAMLPKLPDLTSLLRPFELSDLHRKMQARIDLVSSAYATLNSTIQRIALVPSTASALHVAETMSLVRKWHGQERAVEPLLASIAYTEAEVSSQEADIVEYPDVFDFDQLEEDPQFDAFLPTQNLYYIQRTELILIARKTPHALEDESALNSLPTMQYFNVAQSVCRLVTVINRQCGVCGLETIFRLTNKLAESLIALPESSRC